jgi:hypothetical protein
MISIVQSKTLWPESLALNQPTMDALNWLKENRYGDYLFMWLVTGSVR